MVEGLVSSFWMGVGGGGVKVNGGKVMVWELGNGGVARFWFDSLLEEEILKKKYGRLFSISLQHDVVGNIGAWVGNEWV